MFYEQSNHKVSCHRIETTTGNGVPDLMVILPFGIYLIESKFETTKLRSEQAAFQIRANEVSEADITRCFTLTAYPKTKRFVVSRYDAASITEDGIKPTKKDEYMLNPSGFTESYKTLCAIHSPKVTTYTPQMQRLCTAAISTCAD